VDAKEKSRSLQRKRRRIVSLAVALAVAFLLATVHGFLAESAPVAGEILVVEGWIWNRPALKEAYAEFRQGNYQCVVTVGGPASDSPHGGNQVSTAGLAAVRLKEFGLEEKFIIALSATEVEKHRTYTSAAAFKSWMLKHSPKTQRINVFTLGVHARKSKVIFRKVMGPQVQVGVIAGAEAAYVPSRWWLSSLGIKLVIRNAVGYLYAAVWPLPKDLEV
jgi:hypothetical protein